ncbi:NF-kappa-B inhibitor-like protein 1 [Thalassophryne amazonica]|uniref:NF-kappa-B inhibitor-like protein 1 n=1 Tax=Thalassophryne amazonica TaxID=390379 RepID=UPI0014723069|nr:NF-kappa-B inhibitor-like protein 1 [Thalassophryne amazonica]
MVSSRQKRVWRFVAERRFRRLKRYLRKHPELDVNFCRKRRRWSPLHLACSLGDSEALLLLLRRGANLLQEDASGDTPLHIAARKARKLGPTAYEDLFVPLQRSHPEAMSALNQDGVTPEELLYGRTCTRAEGCRTPLAARCDREWTAKLLNEGADEFCEAFGAYDGVDEEINPFGDWADRVREEYLHKKHTEAQRHAASFTEQRKREREEAERSRKELHVRLQKEHEEYLKRAARKQEETLRSKKRSYSERCAATFSGSSSVRANLTYDDIPWPAPHGSIQKMMAVILHGVDQNDVPSFRKMLRKQQALWHPDKFSQRCEAQLEEKDKQLILDTVKALSQELNSLAQSLKT